MPLELPGSYDAFAAADFDGDGKEDIVISARGKILLYRNNSSPGNLSFDSSTNIPFSANYSVERFCLTDADGDGKVDMISSFSNASNLFIYKNISEPGAIRFDNAVPVNESLSGGMIIVDLNGDGKEDILYAAGMIQQNNSTPGVISFGARTNTLSTTGSTVAAGDLDNDGKLDLVFSNYYNLRMAVLKNTSTSTNFSFEAPIYLPTLSNPQSIAISDMDGDGKADIVVGLIDKQTTIFKNIGSSGTISFANKIDIQSGLYFTSTKLSIADINNDGKNDMLTVTQAQPYLSICINKVKPEPFISSFTPGIGQPGTVVTITGTNFTGITSVMFGTVQAASFTVVSSTTISAVVANGSSGNVTVTNNYGSATLPGFSFGLSPVIDSVSQTAAGVNSRVTIFGKYFNSNPAGNTVYFGAMKANVVNATATTLLVTVPFGSEYKNISVTTAGLTAISPSKFITSFPGGGSINNQTFAARAELPTIAGAATFSDVDGDGKPDAIGLKSSDLAVFVNRSTTGNFDFASPKLFPGAASSSICLADFDGDGLQDVAIPGDNVLSVLKNTSSPGNPAFATKHTIVTTTSGRMTAADMDMDGKPDLAFTGNPLMVLKNTSESGNFLFSAQPAVPTVSTPGKVFLEDMDGDRKPELVTSEAIGMEFSVYPNTSLSGSISFGNSTSYGSTKCSSSFIGDIDKDGKSDILLLKRDSLLIYRNLSMPGAIAFAPKISLLIRNNSSFSSSLCVNDLDGDGNPDVIIAIEDSNKIVVLKNMSTQGNILLAPGVNYPVNAGPSGLTSADLDNDGKADIRIANSRGVLISASILRNLSGASDLSILSFTPASALTGAPVTIIGNGFLNATSVSFGGIPADSFIINSNNSITAFVGSGASGDVTVSVNTSFATLTGFQYGGRPLVTSFNPSTAFVGTVVTINGANLSGASSVSFGGVMADSFQIVSSGTIKAWVAPNSKSGDIVVMAGLDSLTLSGFSFYPPPTITAFTPASVSNRASILITGTNFKDVITVRFGGIPAYSFTVVSSDSISAVVDNGTSGDVTVVTPGGTATSDGLYYGAGPLITSFTPTSAPKGTPIVIRGTKLGGVRLVRFGGTPAASFVVNSPTCITAIVDTGSNGRVAVTNNNGTSSMDGFTYLPATQPGILNFSPAIATAGTLINIEGFNFTNVTAVAIGGAAATSFVVVSPSLIQAVVGSATSGNIVVTTATGSVTATGFILTAAPYIRSFVPATGFVGSKVYIQGNNFNPVASSNIVYFGAVKATVLAASTTSLTVVVPKGATYSKITVTSNRLTGYSPKAFLPTFPGTGTFDNNSFKYRLDSLAGSRPANAKLGDIDADGNADITVSNNGDDIGALSFTSFHTNNTSPSALALASRKMLADLSMPTNNILSDFNGDGKLDLCSTSSLSGNGIAISANTSTGGTASFGTPYLPANSLFIGLNHISVADFNGDGKPDIAVAGLYSGACVFKNTSNAGTISFYQRQIVPVLQSPTSLALDDIDQDGKIDMIVIGSSKLAVLLNGSTADSIMFKPMITFDLPGSIRTVLTHELTGDAFPDLIITTEGTNGFCTVKNLSKPGFVLFAPQQDILYGSKVTSIALHDLDGDSKPDFVVANSALNSIGVYKNISAGGEVRLAPKADYNTSAPASGITLGDIDGDGKPEIVLCQSEANSISILKNLAPAAPVPIQVCRSANNQLVADITGSFYQWQVNTGNGFTNIGNGGIYSGANTAVLQYSNQAVDISRYTFRCRVDNRMSSELSVKLRNEWTGAINSSWEVPGNWSCNQIPDENTDVFIGKGTVVLNSTGFCRSIDIYPSVSFTITTGNQLIITP